MTVIDEIASERKRQIEVEGWTPEHDDEHRLAELSFAALSYVGQVAANLEGACLYGVQLEPEKYRSRPAPKFWPWDLSGWKPKDPRSDLVRAAALIVAEIERLDRAEGR